MVSVLKPATRYAHLRLALGMDAPLPVLGLLGQIRWQFFNRLSRLQILPDQAGIVHLVAGSAKQGTSAGRSEAAGETTTAGAGLKGSGHLLHVLQLLLLRVVEKRME